LAVGFEADGDVAWLSGEVDVELDRDELSWRGGGLGEDSSGLGGILAVFDGEDSGACGGAAGEPNAEWGPVSSGDRAAEPPVDASERAIVLREGARCGEAQGEESESQTWTFRL
jgi:hypothetical protein